MNEHLDRELGVKAIVGFAAGLVVVTVVSAALLWWLSGSLRDWEAAKDPPPPALAAASESHTPPAPRLQADPVADILELRAREDAALNSFGWVDREAGIARIPIERAIELTASAPEHSGDSPEPITALSSEAARTEDQTAGGHP